MGSFHPITRVAVVGAGPVGTACAKYLLAEKAFDTVDIFEQRDRVGGIWNISSTDRTRRIPIPQENPTYGAHRPSVATGQNGTGDNASHELNNNSLEFESPLYDYLEANIPKHVMQYSDTPFPEQCPLFPSHEETLEYLQRYADDLKHLIRFETQVQNIRRANEEPADGPDQWELTFRNLLTGQVDRARYDAVVVASGHYTVPQVSALPGLAEWNGAYPGSILHSKAYRRPEPFKDRRILVIGNSASGIDITTQIGPNSSHVYLSGKSVSIFGSGQKTPYRDDVGETVEFLPPQKYNRAVRTKDGQIIENLDVVIFATGYFYSFPFLSELDPPLITDGLRTRDVYQHFLHIEYPSLALPVLSLRIVPFGLAENQAAVIARLWSGRLPFPSKDTMRQWEAERFESNGTGKHFHLKKFPEEAAQMNDLHAWAMSARPNPELVENDGHGKLGLPWDEYRVWLRTVLLPIKEAYAKRGDERRLIRSIQDLGFDYEAWRQNAKPEEMEMFKKARCPL